jgi:AraC-like DNA-binding protein
MTIKPERLSIWRAPETGNWELRRGVGVARPVPRHWHEELQLCLVEAGASELLYKGTSHQTPPGSVFIMNPGEVHANRALEATGCSYRTVYLNPEVVGQITAEINDRSSNDTPFFRSTVISDPDISATYLGLCRSLESNNRELELAAQLRELISKLVTRHCEFRSALKPVGHESRAIQRARDYLTDNYARNVTLEELAQVTQLSAFHLNRAFCREVGLPPHAFQIQVRILRARSLLRQGATISGSAVETGFADQSHLTRHFKRLAVVTPGQYQDGSKNVQDGM